MDTLSTYCINVRRLCRLNEEWAIDFTNKFCDVRDCKSCSLRPSKMKLVLLNSKGEKQSKAVSQR